MQCCIPLLTGDGDQDQDGTEGRDEDTDEGTSDDATDGDGAGGDSPGDSTGGDAPPADEDAGDGTDPTAGGSGAGMPVASVLALMLSVGAAAVLAL